MVAPHYDVLNVLYSCPGLVGYLGHGPVLVQTGQGGEVLLRDGGGEVTTDHGIGVGRVAHHHHLAVTMSLFVNGHALGLEDLGVGREQVLPFHARASGTGPYQDSHFTALEAGLLVNSASDGG